MSKKLIAVAAAAALALTGLVGVAPANATAATVAITGGTGTGSASDPKVIPVPSQNIINTGTTALLLDINGLDAGDKVEVTSTGSVKILEAVFTAASVNLDHTTVGKASYSDPNVDADGDLDLFVFTTTTTTGTVAVSIVRTGITVSQTFSVKGSAGLPYKIAATGGVPSSLASGATSVVTFTLQDSLGNFVENSSATGDIDRSAAVAGSTAAMGLITWDATAKVYKSTMTSNANTAFIASLTLPSNDFPNINGFATATRSLSAVVNSPASATANATATAQIAALTAQLANSRGKDVSVTKKKYNALAKRWNSAFPGQKVALKQ